MLNRIDSNDIPGLITVIMVFLFFTFVAFGLILHEYRMDSIQLECQKSGYTWDQRTETCLTGNVRLEDLK